MKVHKFPLSNEDSVLDRLFYRVFYSAYNTFNLAGRIEVSGGFGGGSYGNMMKATDQAGQPRSYLASEENFQAVRAMHAKNLIVPVVGDFAGPKALRRVGQYHPGTRLNRRRVLYLQCRAIPLSAGRRVAKIPDECLDIPAGRFEYVHPSLRTLPMAMLERLNRSRSFSFYRR